MSETNDTYEAPIQPTELTDNDQYYFHETSRELTSVETARNLVRAANHATQNTIAEKQRVIQGPIEKAKMSLQYTSLVRQMRRAEVGGMLMSEPLTKSDFDLAA